jgi:hypothetical protein
MKRTNFAAPALCLLVGLASHAAFAAEVPYVDDRSDAEAVVRSLYNAITRHEYARAWGYFGETKPAGDFDAFAKGFDNTDRVDVQTGGVAEEGAAGSVYFTVPVAIKAVATDGTETVFSGCYTLRQVNGQLQEPPFNPIHIEKGELKPSTSPFESAMPESCGDAPPPPRKDVVLEQAKNAFAAAYASQCSATQPDGKPTGEPESHVIHYTGSDATGETGEREARLFRFACSMGAYNEDAVYYLSSEPDAVRQVQFASPELDIHYESADSQAKVEAVNIIGFQTDNRWQNSSYDDATRSITSHANWRGAGDAGTSGTWLFRNGRFSLVQFDVDASYDNEINPQTVLDYNTAP